MELPDPLYVETPIGEICNLELLLNTSFPTVFTPFIILPEILDTHTVLKKSSYVSDLVQSIFR